MKYGAEYVIRAQQKTGPPRRMALGAGKYRRIVDAARESADQSQSLNFSLESLYTSQSNSKPGSLYQDRA